LHEAVGEERWKTIFKDLKRLAEVNKALHEDITNLQKMLQRVIIGTGGGVIVFLTHYLIQVLGG